MANYVTLSDRYVEQQLTPYSSSLIGAGEAEISLADLELFLQQLDQHYITLSQLTEPLIKNELRTKAWQLLNLPANHPIKGCYVVRSRPSGDGVIWRDDPFLWIYPTTTVNGASSPTFAYARQSINGVYVAYVHAPVAAIN
jgi:hypothetical protein